MKKLKNLLFATALCSSFFSYAEDCKLKVGYSDYPPVTYDDPNGKAIGLDIELLDVIVKKAGCSVVWEKFPWERVINNVRNGELNLTTSCSDSEERRKFANLVGYREGGNSVFVRKSDLDKFKDIQSLADLVNKTDSKIGVFVGYDYGPVAASFLSDPKYKNRFDAVPDSVIISNFKKLDSGRVDAVILEKVVGMSLIKTNNLEDKLVALPFRLSPEEDLVNYLLISKAADPDGKIYEKIKAATEAVKNTDEYKAIDKKYN